MKYLLILLGLISIVSCIPKYDEKKPDINVIAKDVLKGYKYEITNNLLKKHVVIQGIDFVEKINDSDFEVIKSRLIENKWKLVYSENDQFVFCRDKYNVIIFMYPRKTHYVSKIGGDLYISSGELYEWGGSYYYKEEGNKYCLNEFD